MRNFGKELIEFGSIILFKLETLVNIKRLYVSYKKYLRQNLALTTKIGFTLNQEPCSSTSTSWCFQRGHQGFKSPLP